MDEKDFSVEVEGFWPVMESLFSTLVVDLFYDGLFFFLKTDPSTISADICALNSILG